MSLPKPVINVAFVDRSVARAACSPVSLPNPVIKVAFVDRSVASDVMSVLLDDNSAASASIKVASIAS